MKIVCIADNHGFNVKDIPNGDILICAGDVSMTGTFTEIANFNYFLKKLPHTFKIYIAGNHDWLYETDPVLAPGLVNNAIYLFDSATKVKGLKIFGTPWQPRFCNWAFNRDDAKDLPHLYKRIPKGLDILVAHCPPYSVLDTVNDGPHLGSKALLERIKIVKPKVCVFGHIHDSYGIQKKDGITYINASVTNELYEVKNRPIVIEL